MNMSIQTFKHSSYRSSVLMFHPERHVVKEAAQKSKFSVPVYMWDIYKNSMNNSGNSSSVDVVKGITPMYFGHFFRSHFYPNHGKQEVEFGVPQTRDDETLLNAEVRIMTNKIPKLNVSLQIYQKKTNWIFLDEKAVDWSMAVDWISLNVTTSVSKVKKSIARVSYLIICLFGKVNVKPFRFIEHMEPVLLLSYSVKKHGHPRDVYPRGGKTKSKIARRKRNLSENYERKTNGIWDDSSHGQIMRSTCRRKPLYVEFSEINYDSWIVAPTGYEAFQCVGKCSFPVSEHLSPTKHAIVQTLMHHVSPSKAGKACCVPTKLDPISMLYIDSSGILTYRLHYHDMVVAECGCR